MKKAALLLTILTFAAALASCSQQASSSQAQEKAEAPSTVTIEHELGATEAPYAPKRVFVLDLPSLDTIDALGLGEYVAGVQEFRNIPDYLQKYYDGSLIVLPTASHIVSQEELDSAYNAIDGDLIIGGSRQVDAYEFLSGLAPTLIMYSNGSYSGWGETKEETDPVRPLMDVTRSEATKIASLWGKEAEVEEILAGYESRIASLKAAATGTSGLVLQANAQVGGMVPAASSSRLLDDIGFVNLANDAPEDLGGIEALTTAARAAAAEQSESESSQGGEQEERQEGGSRASIAPEDAAKAMQTVNEWIAGCDPQYVFILDTYSSLQEAASAGTEYPGVTELNAYKAGKLFFLSSITTSRGGLGYAKRQIEELEKAFNAN